MAFEQSISITKYLYWKILSEEISSEDVVVDSLAPSIENLTISNVAAIPPSTTPAAADPVSETSTQRVRMEAYLLLV